MSTTRTVEPRDRVLPATKVLSAVIIPFLVVAFVLLYFWPSPDDTARLFAWRIVPEFTSMVLASVYLGGSYFFLRAIYASQWHRVAGGFVPVGLFAALMGVATILHWGKFIHTNLAFWLWAILYFTTPFLVFGVWWRNRRENVPAAVSELLLPPVAAAVIAVSGAAALLTCCFLFLAPSAAMKIWPWTLTPLTARVVGAIFALGVAGLGAVWDKRWSSARILIQVAGFMLVLIAVAAVRARHDFDPGKPLTWVFLVGFVAVAVGTAALYVRMERRVARAGRD
jgi:hypothetical protein